MGKLHTPMLKSTRSICSSLILTQMRSATTSTQVDSQLGAALNRVCQAQATFRLSLLLTAWYSLTRLSSRKSKISSIQWVSTKARTTEILDTSHRRQSGRCPSLSHGSLYPGSKSESDNQKCFKGFNSVKYLCVNLSVP